MICAQFEERLQLLLDRRKEPSEDASLARHARRCAACRETLSACARMIDGLHLLELPVPDDHFSLRVLNRTSICQPPLVGRRRFHSTFIAVAAALALVLLVSVAWRTDRPDAELSNDSTLAAIPAAALQRAEDRTSRMAPARYPDGEPPTPFSESSQQPLVLLLSWTAAWSDLTRISVDGLADGLTSITAPLSVAVEEIRRTIPLGFAEEQPLPSADSVRRQPSRDVPPVA